MGDWCGMLEQERVAMLVKRMKWTQAKAGLAVQRWDKNGTPVGFTPPAPIIPYYARGQLSTKVNVSAIAVEADTQLSKVELKAGTSEAVGGGGRAAGAGWGGRRRGASSQSAACSRVNVV